MIHDMLSIFLKNKTFKHTVDYIKAVEVKDFGRNKITYLPAIKKDVVLLSSSSSKLIAMGFDKLIDKSTFFLYTPTSFSLGLNDIIVYLGNKYQRKNQNDFTEYGYYKYIISIYNENTLNEEQI